MNSPMDVIVCFLLCLCIDFLISHSKFDFRLSIVVGVRSPHFYLGIISQMLLGPAGFIAGVSPNSSSRLPYPAYSLMLPLLLVVSASNSSSSIGFYHVGLDVPIPSGFFLPIRSAIRPCLGRFGLPISPRIASIISLVHTLSCPYGIESWFNSSSRMLHISGRPINVRYPTVHHHPYGIGSCSCFSSRLSHVPGRPTIVPPHPYGIPPLRSFDSSRPPSSVILYGFFNPTSTSNEIFCFSPATYFSM